MGQLTTLDTPPDNVIEGNFSVAKEEVQRTFQATISSLTEKLKSGVGKDRGLDNIMVEAVRPNRETAFFALRQYLLKRAAHITTKSVFDLALRNVKPKVTTKGIRHTFEWYEPGDPSAPVASYEVILIEIG